MLDLQDRALLSSAARDLDAIARDLSRDHLDYACDIGQAVGRIRAVLNHHLLIAALDSEPQVPEAVLIPPPLNELHGHEPAQVSEHDFDRLCEADLHTASSCQPIVVSVDGVGCTEEGVLSSVKPLPTLLQPSKKEVADVPVRMVSRRSFGSVQKPAAGPVVDLILYRLSQQSTPTDSRT